MAYLGNQPALSYTSFAKQDFTTSATTSYTLDHPVTNENEIALFINFVRQEPTTAYTASGTTLTLTSATSASDDMYCVFLGKAVQTVNPPSGSVGTAQLANEAVTPEKQTALANPFASQLLHVRDEKSSGTKGGTSVDATDNIRTLNTVLTNEITNASLSSNRITLPSGTFYIEAHAPAREASRHRLFLYNHSDSIVTLLGTNCMSTTVQTNPTNSHSFVRGRFTISSSKNFELRHYTEFGEIDNGLGSSINDSITEVYADARIWRIA
jgi:hypothetical protein